MLKAKRIYFTVLDAIVNRNDNKDQENRTIVFRRIKKANASISIGERTSKENNFSLLAYLFCFSRNG